MTNQEVDNNRVPNYVVKTTELTDTSQIQHMRLDVGVGTAEDLVSSANPLPVTIASGGGDATAANQLTQISNQALMLAVQQSQDANLEVLQDLVQALKQIRKTLEPIATQDTVQRQRVVVESTVALAANTIIGAANINSVNAITQGGTAPTVGAYTFQPVWEGPVDQRYRVADAARTMAYLQRQNLTFS